MVQRLVSVGPEDLLRSLKVVSEVPHLPEAQGLLRQLVDEPLEALFLAEEAGLGSQEGLAFRLTQEGKAWLEHPSDPPPGLLAHLLVSLPWERVLKALKARGNTLPLTEVLPLFPQGPKGEKAARALAEWGAVLGFWDLVGNTLERR